MNILKRLKNLWKLSEYAEVSHDEHGEAIFTVKGNIENYKAVEIIKRTTATQDFLKEVE